MLEMSSGRVDVVVNALILGLTAIAKNPNLGSYKILQTPFGRDSKQHGGAARVRQTLARFPRGVGRVQPRHRPDARMVRQGHDDERRQTGRRAGRAEYLNATFYLTRFFAATTIGAVAAQANDQAGPLPRRFDPLRYPVATFKSVPG
jgi:hypothetical protein